MTRYALGLSAAAIGERLGMSQRQIQRLLARSVDDREVT